MITEIRDIRDVEIFMKLLVEEGTNAHPDEDFENYVNVNSGEPVYTPEEVRSRNILMERCFVVCKDSGHDIYEVMQEVFLKETGLDKVIPLPSQL